MKEFIFEATICRVRKTFRFELPTIGNMVITNKFCPKDFLVPRNSFFNAITPQNGESIEEFENDCTMFTNCLNENEFNSTNNKWNVYMAAMDDLVARHIGRCGRIFFNDLLLYIDLFCYFLYADGIDEDNIKLNYPRFVNQYLINASNYLKDSYTQIPLENTQFANIIRELAKKSEIELGL